MALVSVLLLLQTGCGKVCFTCDDVILAEDQDTILSAVLVRDTPFGTIRPKDVEVVFYADGVEIERARTGGEGFAQAVKRIPPGTQRIEARTTIDGQDYTSPGKIYEWGKDRVAIMCDIDGTIAETSVSGLAFESRDTKSKPMENSREVLARLSEKFDLVYLTARPIYLLEKSRAWLEDHGYPAAPLYTLVRVRESMDAARYKSDSIQIMHKVFPDILIGIGNAGTDMEAYSANGMLALMVDDGKGRLFSAQAIQLQTWEQVERFVEANLGLLENPDALRDVIANGGMILQPVIPWDSGS
jgi:hypothetical protein